MSGVGIEVCVDGGGWAVGCPAADCASRFWPRFLLRSFLILPIRRVKSVNADGLLSGRVCRCLGGCLVALGLFCVVGEVGDDADEVVGGGGLGGGDGAVDGAPGGVALGAVAGGPGGGQGGGDACGGVCVVVGDGVVGVWGSGVGGGCGGGVSPVPGVGGGGELDVDGGAQDGGGLVAGGGVGVDDEGFGDDDLGSGWLAGDA